MEQKDYRLAAIMYTDIAGFSRMMGEDESGTIELLRYHNELIGGIVGRHHGTIIKTIGDALLIDFKNTVEALQSALEIQDQLYARNKQHADNPLLVRIGLHLGDIYFYEDDALGEGINIAARLQSLARPGCICLSQDVYNIVLNKLEFRAEKLGKVSLKNITKEIHAYEIASPNVEFDPNRDKPRPGYKPGAYLEGQGGEAPAEAAHAAAPAAAERDYGPDGSRDLLKEIRKAILEESKSMGRRMRVDEARQKYGFYGVEAAEVIAEMADQGILARAQRPAEASFAPPRSPWLPGAPRAPGAPFDAEAIGKNIEAVVQGIVSGIERSVDRSMGSAEKGGVDSSPQPYRHEYRDRIRYERYAMRDAIRGELSAGETGRWDRKLMEDDEWKPGEEELSRDFQGYRDKLTERCRRNRSGLVGHLIAYGGVNAFLWYLNATTSKDFPWSVIVSLGWGIGLVSSIVAFFRAGRKIKEIDTMPELDPGQLELYKKINRMTDSMAQHAASTFSVPLLLGYINVVTDPSFLWFLIPTAAMALGFLSHLAAYLSSKRRIVRKLLDSLGIKGGWNDLFKGAKARREKFEGLGPYAGSYREAQAARDAIAELLASDAAGPVDAEFLPSLDHYLEQVRLLAHSANEIDRIVEAIPMTDLAADKAALVAKRDGASSASLKSEYDRSIEEIDKQERSYGELTEQSEVLKLRLSSSVNQLKQIRLDMARIQASPGSASGAPVVDAIRDRTEELSRYLEDLRAGYDESRRDPFAELEEAERRKQAEAGRLEAPTAGGEAPPAAEGLEKKD